MFCCWLLNQWSTAWDWRYSVLTAWKRWKEQQKASWIPRHSPPAQWRVSFPSCGRRRQAVVPWSVGLLSGTSSHISCWSGWVWETKQKRGTKQTRWYEHEGESFAYYKDQEMFKWWNWSPQKYSWLQNNNLQSCSFFGKYTKRFLLSEHTVMINDLVLTRSWNDVNPRWIENTIYYILSFWLETKLS